MLVTLSGMVIVVRLVQFAKAPPPILVTLSGIVMLVRLVQKRKASSPMLVTGISSMKVGMIRSPDAFLLESVIVTASPSVSYFKLGSLGSLLFSPSHPMRKLKAKRGIKYFIFVCDCDEINFRETLQSE